MTVPEIEEVPVEAPPAVLPPPPEEPPPQAEKEPTRRIIEEKKRKDLRALEGLDLFVALLWKELLFFLEDSILDLLP